MPVEAAIAAVGIGASLIGSSKQASATKSAAATQSGAAAAGIREQRKARQAFARQAAPFRRTGIRASNQLTNLLENPRAGLAQINPIVNILRNQGFEQIQETAAAQGRLGAGGTLRDLTRFNTQLGTTIIPQLQNQRFNQLFNAATLGANVTAGQGTAGLQTASNIGNLLTQQGAAQAGGTIGASNAFTGGLQNIAGTLGAFPGLFGGTPGAGGATGANFSSTPGIDLGSFGGSTPIFG